MSMVREMGYPTTGGSPETTHFGLTGVCTDRLTEFHESPGYNSYNMNWMRFVEDSDKRQAPRRELRNRMVMIETDPEDDIEPQTVQGECLNVGDGGLYGIVPIGFGVAMGQRYTFQVCVDECGPEPGQNQVVTQQGIVVRTELLINNYGEGDRVGIGVQLIGQRSGVIPMPEHV